MTLLEAHPGHPGENKLWSARVEAGNQIGVGVGLGVGDGSGLDPGGDSGGDKEETMGLGTIHTGGWKSMRPSPPT